MTSQPAQVPTRYGRVIEAQIDRFTAECFSRDCAPPLGQLVALEDGEQPIYAVVAGVVTEGIDPDRRIAAHGGPDDDLARVLAEHPHVPALLLTSFSAVVVGHSGGGWALQYLPPTPAPILARVRSCDDDEVRWFTRSFEYLHLLLDAGPFADEVIAASLRLMARVQPDGRTFLVGAGKALAPLLARDPMRLQATLRRMRP